MKRKRDATARKQAFNQSQMGLYPCDEDCVCDTRAELLACPNCHITITFEEAAKHLPKLPLK
jgi:hypothetical protein